MLTRRSTSAGRWDMLAGCGAFTTGSLALKPASIPASAGIIGPIGWRDSPAANTQRSMLG